MDEQKVRKAVKIANELVPWTSVPDFAYSRNWELVFTALITEPYQPMWEHFTARAGAKVGRERE